MVCHLASITEMMLLALVLGYFDKGSALPYLGNFILYGCKVLGPTLRGRGWTCIESLGQW